MSEGAILVLNAGSSSLKAGLFAPDASAFVGEQAIVTAEVTGIGQSGGRLSVEDASGSLIQGTSHALESQEEALCAVQEALQQHGGGRPVTAVGHRVVHGGPRLREHVRVSPEVLATLREAVHFAPLHLPASIAMIEGAQRLYPGVPQVVCLDTAFHRTMPELARRLPIPAAYAAAGVERYGFHGLSYESLVAQLRGSPEGLPARVVLAHLGSGASLCAVHRGRSVDTTMGLTPTGGVLMATRTGDLDPGVLLFLARSARLSTEGLEKLVNREGGLAAVAEGSGDMKVIEELRSDRAATPRQRAAARLAFDQFAESVAKSVAAMTVALSGLDLLVFAGGIGEHSASVREAVVTRLAPFGMKLDAEANRQGTRLIHSTRSIAPIAVLPAQEDPIIAAHTRVLVG